MIKKLFAAILSLSIVFMSVGSFVFDGHDSVVSAKSYKSGKRSFNLSPSSPSQIKKTETNSFTKKSTNSKSFSDTFKKGSFMRGLLYGGIAGMLLGGLLGNLGAFGAVIGFLINVLAIVVLISLLRGIFRMMNNKRREQEEYPWRR